MSFMSLSHQTAEDLGIKQSTWNGSLATDILEAVEYKLTFIRRSHCVVAGGAGETEVDNRLLVWEAT